MLLTGLTVEQMKTVGNTSDTGTAQPPLSQMELLVLSFDERLKTAEAEILELKNKLSNNNNKKRKNNEKTV